MRPAGGRTNWRQPLRIGHIADRGRVTHHSYAAIEKVDDALKRSRSSSAGARVRSSLQHWAPRRIEVTRGLLSKRAGGGCLSAGTARISQTVV
eukprot:6187295-Pleurochrysis_carterae.AAC.1